jgi:chromosome segregation ATPase
LYQRHERDVEAHQSQVTDLKTQISDIILHDNQGRRASSTPSHLMTNPELERYEREIRQLKQRIMHLETGQENNNQQMDALESIKMTYEKQVLSLQKQIAELETDNMSLRDELETSKINLESSREGARESRRRSQSAAADVEVMRARLATAEHEHRKHLESLEHSQGILAEKDRRITQLQNAVDDLRSIIAKKEANNVRLCLSLETLKTQYGDRAESSRTNRQASLPVNLQSHREQMETAQLRQENDRMKNELNLQKSRLFGLKKHQGIQADIVQPDILNSQLAELTSTLQQERQNFASNELQLKNQVWNSNHLWNEPNRKKMLNYNFKTKSRAFNRNSARVRNILATGKRKLILISLIWKLN